MKKLSALLGLVLTISACGHNSGPTVEAISAVKQSPIYSSDQSKIIGQNDLIKVKADGSNVDTNLRQYLNAFGIIDMGNASCSGTHIGNGYVLTAGHCILPDGQSGILTNKDCSNIKVLWGYRGSPDTGSAKPVVIISSQCTNVVYAERSALRDFAIFKVDRAPSVALPISRSGIHPSAGTKLTIFGYPQGRPLEWSQYCPLVNIDSVPSQFAYQCDTEPGNSGSSVLAINSSGTPVVVGIHDLGLPTDDYNVATQFSDAVAAVKAKTGTDLTIATQQSLGNLRVTSF
jgi:V8-like Glu-specific endopeptidase